MRKQVQVTSKLCQTILQSRIEPSESLGLHLKEIRKKVRSMRQKDTYEEGIIEMLVSKQSFQIKQKLMRAISLETTQQQQINIQIRITATLKRNGEIYNEQLWQFGIRLENGNHQRKIDSTEGSVHLMEQVLKHLECSSLLPLNKEQKNRFIVNYQVNLKNSDIETVPFRFQKISAFQVVIAREDGMPHRRLTSKFYYNVKKVQQSLKEMIMEKSFQRSQSSKKNSTDSTESSRRYSIHDHYDDELDITVLSNEEITEDDDDSENDEFQILIQETMTKDKLFIHQNSDLFSKFSLASFC